MSSNSRAFVPIASALCARTTPAYQACLSGTRWQSRRSHRHQEAQLHQVLEIVNVDKPRGSAHGRPYCFWSEAAIAAPCSIQRRALPAWKFFVIAPAIDPASGQRLQHLACSRNAGRPDRDPRPQV